MSAAFPRQSSYKKTGADSKESAPVLVVGFEWFARLERKPGAELTLEGPRNNTSSPGVYETLGLQESAGRICVVEVVAIIGFVGQVESLENELQIPALVHANVLRDSHVHLEEGISAKRVVAYLMAGLGGQAGQRISGGAYRCVVCWVRIWHDHGPGVAAPTI